MKIYWMGVLVMFLTLGLAALSAAPGSPEKSEAAAAEVPGPDRAVGPEASPGPAPAPGGTLISTVAVLVGMVVIAVVIIAIVAALRGGRRGLKR